MFMTTIRREKDEFDMRIEYKRRTPIKTTTHMNKKGANEIW